MVAAAASSLAKSNIKPANAGDITSAVRSIVRKTEFIVASLFSSPDATITIQSLSITILQPTEARFAILEAKITAAGTIHLGIS